MAVLEYIISLKDEVSGPAQSAASSLGGLQSALVDLPGILLAVAAAVGTAAVAFGALVIKGAEVAVEAGEARAKMLSLFDAMGHGKTQGKEVLDLLDSMSAKIGLTREQLAPMAQQLEAIGITDLGQLQKQLTAIATIRAIGGTEAADKYISVLGKLQEGVKVTTKDLLALQKAGIDVDAIAHELGYKTFTELSKAITAGKVSANQFKDAMTAAVTQSGAGALAEQANNLTTLWERFKASITHLFEGVDFSPFTKGLSKIVDLFDQNTASGKAMHEMIVAAYNAIFEAGSKVLPYLETAMKKVIIAALEIYIAIKPAIASIGQLISSGNVGGKAMGAFTFALNTLVTAIKFLAPHVQMAVMILRELFDVTSIGNNLVTSLANGIRSGAGAVYDAIENLAQGAVSSLKGALGIHSPSKVMLEMGTHTATGFAQGVEAATPQVAVATTKMAAQATGSASGAGTSGGKAGSSVVVNIDSIRIDGAGKSAAGITTEMVATVFEELALAQGLG